MMKPEATALLQAASRPAKPSDDIAEVGSVIPPSLRGGGRRAGQALGRLLGVRGDGGGIRRVADVVGLTAGSLRVLLSPQVARISASACHYLPHGTC